MVSVLATALLFALTREEIIARFKSPAVTQADGFVRVYANCPEDMRREYQSPVARFAADTVETLYRGRAMKSVRFEKPGLVLTIGDVRTNLSEVVTRVETNDARVLTRIYLPSPGYADLGRLRLELIRGFYRVLLTNEISEAEAVAAWRHAVPELRVADERAKLEDWLAGRGAVDDEEGISLMRRVFEPGKASPRDILIFASRLYLYPPQADLRLAGKFTCLSFREAVKYGRIDELTRQAARAKADDMPVFGGGRGDALLEAAMAYRAFLLVFAGGEASEDVLLDLLEAADTKLNLAYEKCEK